MSAIGLGEERRQASLHIAVPTAAALVLVLGSAAVVSLAASAGPAASAGSGAATRLAEDPILAALIRDGLDRRPELAQAQATVRADREQVPQAGALPDPVLSLGLQNDGFFDDLKIGEMETSWWAIVAAQTFPLRGQRGLRATAQTLESRQSEADLDRARLTVQADVERAYVDLLLIRDRLGILASLEALWIQAEGLSRARYESGEGAQADILRSQLERGRLRQQRFALEAEERRRIAALNRAAGRPLEAPVPTMLSLGEVADPALTDSAEAEADAEARSPELQRARLGIERSRTLVTLAGREAFPDVTVSAGIMPRGGEFETMWQAGLSFSLPLWGAGRRSGLAAESRFRAEAATAAAEATRRLLHQRIVERRAVLAALLEANRIYRSGLLVQSEATVSSAMASYQVGRVPFASVLEALSGYLADRVGFYESVAAAQRTEVAQRELSLESVEGVAAGGMGGSVPGSATMGGAAPAALAPTATPAAAPATAMPRM